MWSLPLPLSPVIKRVAGATATFSASSKRRSDAGSAVIHGNRSTVIAANDRFASGAKRLRRKSVRARRANQARFVREEDRQAGRGYRAWGPCAKRPRDLT